MATSTSKHAPYAGKVLDSALDAIGNTPLIRLDRLAKVHGLKCNLYGKLEYFNVGGSVKDRMSLSMLEAAEREGKMIPGKSTLIEATAGNTGAALAMMAAVRGYNVILVLPQRMSIDKDVILRALGAEIVRVPDKEIFNAVDRLISVIPNAVVLNQFANPANPLAHEYTTGPEIIDAIESTVSDGSGRPSTGKVDVFCAGCATGGTMTGVVRALRKSHNPDVLAVGCDPLGSILAEPEELNDTTVPIRLEGMGAGFISATLDRTVVSRWIKVADSESYSAALSVHRHEGLLVGGSSGGIVAGAVKYLKSEEGWKRDGGVEGRNVVIMLPDGIRNYMTQSWLVDSFRNPTAHPYAEKIAEAMKSLEEAQPAQPGPGLVPKMEGLNTGVSDQAESKVDENVVGGGLVAAAED
jgi:cystathionine beta-synthase